MHPLDTREVTETERLEMREPQSSHPLGEVRECVCARIPVLRRVLRAATSDTVGDQNNDAIEDARARHPWRISERARGDRARISDEHG